MPGAAATAVEIFTASDAPAPNGTFTYRVSFVLRESGGTGANLSTVTLTLTQTSGATAATDYTATRKRSARHGSPPTARSRPAR